MQYINFSHWKNHKLLELWYSCSKLAPPTLIFTHVSIAWSPSCDMQSLTTHQHLPAVATNPCVDHPCIHTNDLVTHIDALISNTMEYNSFAKGPPMFSTSHNINKPKFGFLVRRTWGQQFQRCRHIWSPTGRYRVLVFLLVSQNIWFHSEQTDIAKQDCLLLNSPPFLCGPACAYLKKQHSGGEIFSWQCSSNHPSCKSHHIWKHTNLIEPTLDKNHHTLPHIQMSALLPPYESWYFPPLHVLLRSSSVKFLCSEGLGARWPDGLRNEPCLTSKSTCEGVSVQVTWRGNKILTTMEKAYGKIVSVMHGCCLNMSNIWDKLPYQKIHHPPQTSVTPKFPLKTALFHSRKTPDFKVYSNMFLCRRLQPGTRSRSLFTYSCSCNYLSSSP